MRGIGRLGSACLLVGALVGLGGALAPDAAAEVVVLSCPGTGAAGDLAELRGIRFGVSRSFDAVELRLQGSAAGTYTFDAEIRRSTGFVVRPDRIVTGVSAALSGTLGSRPYTAVKVAFPLVPVTGSETFTVKLLNVRGPAGGILYFETFGIGNAPCAGVEETEQNDVAVPTVRGDPAGFRVLAPGLTLASAFAATPPVVDGSIGFGEWPAGGRLQLANGFVAFANDANRLYVLLDVLGDGVDDPANDYFYLTFDVNRDAKITPNVDLNYGPAPSSGNLRYQFYLGPDRWTTLQPDTFSSRGRGFGCFLGDGTLLIQAFPKPPICSAHRVWELAIDLKEIGASAAGKVGTGIRIASGSPSFEVNVPPGFSSDFSELIELSLAPAFVLLPVASPLASVRLDTNPIELTQAIQTRTNALPLVEGKKTVGRVYVDTDLAGTAQPAQAFLYASRGGVDLPGSPLLRSVLAPPVIDRTRLGDTANFELPPAWPLGSVSFRAKSRSSFGFVSSSAAVPLTFTSKSKPTYWIVPVNTGTAAVPVLPTNVEITDQQRYAQTVYPLPGVKWVRKPWQALGAIAGDPTAALNAYYNSTALAWVLGVLFSGSSPFDLPDQIYGFRPTGGGSSDPVWYGGAGHVAYGFRGTSREGTMAHEINHNLDRNTTGTWGRHTPFGCGATGPDSAWPFANDDVQEVGFDTSQPWVDGSGSRKTVIPSNFPDLMSYCQSGTLPTKWISTYRWQRLFSSFPTLLAAAVARTSLAETRAAVESVLYVSGQLNVGGTGGLAPVLVQPGIPSEDVAPGDYAIVLLDARGGQLLRLPFFASFVDVEGEPVDVVPFSFRLPALQGVAAVVLLRERTVLDRIDVSPVLPAVQVVSPNGGERWTGGTQTIRWSASHAGGNPLTFTVLFTPDDGVTWVPVVSGLAGGPAPTTKEFAYSTNAALLPGGTAARVRVIVSDGFNTAQDDSDRTFRVDASAPSVTIDQPAPGAQFVLGESVHFSGSATDPQGGELPSEAFVWSDGPTPFASGPEADASLALGTHTVTLSVVNAAGRSGSASIQIEIVPPPDQDRDGVADAQDNCRYESNPGQQDTGGVGAGSAPDGIGDACQCGDVTGDGRVTLADGVAITRSLLIPPTAKLGRPELCDVGGPATPGAPTCTIVDALVVRRALLVPPTAAIDAVCAPATP